MAAHRLRRIVPYTGITFVLLIVALTFATGSEVFAHPADMYYHTHSVTLTPDGARLTWEISPGTLLAYVTWNNADSNNDGKVDAGEALAWAAPMPDKYLVLVDGQPQTWQLVGVDWPESLVNFELGKETIAIHLTVSWPAAMSDTVQIALYNQFEEYNSSNWFIVQAEDTAQNAAQFRTPLQKNGALTFQLVRGTALEAEAGADPLRTYWDSGTPAIGASGAQVNTPPRRQEDTSASSQLAELVREDSLTLPFYLMAFGIAIGLGALHALTPGHGKALVGAYLVGSRGTMQHALALGGIVTLTHTGSVLTLGLITLAASHILLPTTLFPILEMASGLLVVAMGLMLIYRRYKAWQSVNKARARSSLRAQLPEIPTEYAREHGPAAARQITPQAAPQPATAASTTSVTIQINQPIKVNVYDDVLPQDRVSFGSVNWRALVALGVSGGLVPCPDAIAILLVAVAINRVVFGLSLIVAFSLGLAFILTAIGIAMVRSRRLFEGMNALNRMIPALPLVSALIVTGLGLALTYNAATGSGLFAAQQPRSTSLDFTLGSGQDDNPGDTGSLTLAEAFNLDTAEVIYLDIDDNNRYQLYRVSANGGKTRRLTDSDFGVWDYRLAPDRASIAYATPREFGGSDIWQIDIDGSDPRLLLTCEEAACSRVTWSPDGQKLVYEKLEIASPQSPLGVTTLWWMDIESGNTGPVFRDSQLPSYSPTWSPDGQWLSYIAPGSANIQIYNLTNGQSIAIPSQTGNPAVWSPDGDALLVTEIWEEGNQFFTHVMRYDMTDGTLTDLTTTPQAGDTWATWSPDEQWVAVVRRIYGGPGAAVGDQVWLMRTDGSDARPLTDVSQVIHGKPVWSPDSRYLVFQRYPLAGSDAQAGIWILDTADATLAQLTPTGSWPVWLP